MADRHQFRADWLDYNEGIFFVTICCADKKHLFGSVSNGIVNLNEIGEKANQFIKEIPNHHEDVEIHNHVVMPNHVHILLQLVGTRHVASTANEGESVAKKGCLKGPKHGEPCQNDHFNSRLAVVIGSLKSAVTRFVNSSRTRHVASLQVWQKRFHEHWVRDQHSYDNIYNYITNNPLNWNKDCFY